MRTLKIEWRHLDVAGEACDRCYDTGKVIFEGSEYEDIPARAIRPAAYKVMGKACQGDGSLDTIVSREPSP